MSSSKRQKIEEYHDPDYCQEEAKVKATGSDSDRQDKIKMIIKREFLKEISSKEEEINLIDHKLNQTKRLLQRVRYAVAMSYYTKKNLVYSTNEVKCESSAPDGSSSSVGQAIHPSLKKLLGKKPIDYEEILKNRSPRMAAKTARSTLIKPKKKESAKFDKDAVNQMKVPRYISPTKPDIQIEKINSSRGRNQTSHLIVVGNTSKYIGDEKSANEVTHKWLVYIKTKTSVEIEDMVSKVRFFLHPSYKPNDVIEVDSPPFQISRRGWGEFPIRVQLYFHESINQKPLQIYHNLILDKKLTGLQTMGAETVVEIWLDLQNSSSQNTEHKSVPNKLKPHESVKTLATHKIEKSEAIVAAINIKMEEPLMINESPEVESHEALPEYGENTPASDTTMKSSHGYLNDISDIFEDAAPAKVNSPEMVKSVKLKATPVPQKKTLVRCLDSNGKVVFVELQVDPNNPKNIKIVKAPVIASTQLASLSLAKPANASQLKLIAPMEQKRHAAFATNILSNTPNSMNQHVKVYPISSTNASVNPKPTQIPNTANLMTRLNPVASKSLLENKNVFIIKSSALPSSTNPPPLVRISNPNKLVLAPTMTNLKGLHPTANEARKVTINTNNVVMKNGQIIVHEAQPSQPLPQPKPKQQSLLKPQISLLKPLYQKQTSDAISTKSILIQKPASHILGSRYRKQMPLGQNAAKRDYHKEFLTIFLRHRFQTVRSAVEYLLRNTQLINTLSSKPEFITSFPFVAESHEKFNSFPFPKRRLNEWYRAKFVLRMVQQHPDLKNQLPWMTREVILFGRRFGYTPVNTVALNKSQAISNEDSLKDMIKQHIKAEQLKNVTITYDNRVKDFIEKYDNLTKAYSITSTGPLEIVDVDGEGDDVTPSIESKTKPNEMRGDELVLDVNKIMQSGGMLVNDICHDIRIKMDKEEIVDGVLCSSSQLVLWQAMRSFLEDLIRRSFATKPLAEQTSDLSAERCVRMDDVRKAVSTTENFSFLTNKHLGKRSS